MTYVSRHAPADERRLFPEVPPEHDFGTVDVIADIDHDGLRAFADDSQDFVIAAHVIEHLAAPIAALEEMLRVTRPGGYVLIVLPDRRYTFDKDRLGTSVTHLLEEHTAEVRDVSEEHVREFLLNTGGPTDPTPEELAWHRERSVHVHCWTDDEFDALLTAVGDELGFAFQVADAYDASTVGGLGMEFGYALEVGAAQAQSVSEAKRQLTLQRLADAEATVRDLRQEAAAGEAERAALAAQVDALRKELDGVYESTTWRAGALPRRLRARFRR